jgi:type 2 lantibiotic biosynthesis protein LanM
MIRSLAADASTLEERLGWATPSLKLVADDRVEARLSRWRLAVGRGDADAFARRLTAGGLTLDAIVAAIAATTWPKGRPLPLWTDTLAEALREPRDSSGALFECEEPIAFEEVLSPFVAVARRRVSKRAGDAITRLFAPDAWRAVERLQLRRLSGIAGKVLYTEFQAFRLTTLTSWERLLAAAADTPSRGAYEAFVILLLRGAMRDIVRDYPVMARLMSEATDQWIDATVELVARLDEDRADLDSLFGDDAPLGRVRVAELGLSDPHHGGRMVTALTFDSGRRVVYKPKDLGSEYAFAQVLEWLNLHGAPLGFRFLRMLVREGYGWVEYAPDERCADDASVSRYYQRAGMLLCLVYVLAGTDCHCENIVASGEYPILVDTECLLQHRVPQPTGREIHSLALDELAGGVLGTGLLPSWQVDEESDEPVARDISGLHTPDPEELTERVPRWEHVNTDGMALRMGALVVSDARNVPRLRDRSAVLGDHGDDVLVGFECCYEYLLGHCDELLAPESPIHQVVDQRVRFLFRNTRVYGALNDQLAEPRHLRMGVDRSIEIEGLVVPNHVGQVAGNRVTGGWWPRAPCGRRRL